MYELVLRSLVCNATEDWSGDDEIYLLLSGSSVWGPISMNDNDVVEFSGIPEARFRRKVRVDLYNQDAGYYDDDDHLGRLYARSSQAGKGEQEHRFTGDGAYYTLTYEVVEII